MYAFTVFSPFEKAFMRDGAKDAPAVALGGQKRKMSDLARTVAAVPGEKLPGRLGFGSTFVPIGYNSSGSPSVATFKAIDEHAAAIATHRGSSLGKVKYRLYHRWYLKLSFRNLVHMRRLYT
eukprot:GFKZ01015125.1.p1 GENE.GFKZ01015125.1~~GFKZ01015125.1.p1  ORF type:complete len:122 (+),score=9.45 GFKZ01015125.1:367-732(+)